MREPDVKIRQTAEMAALNPVREITMKILLIVFLAAILVPKLHGQGDWVTYGFDQSGQRHSPLTKIDTNNVSRLKIAWQYGMTSDARNPDNPVLPATEAVPIVIDGMLYTPTVQHAIVALEPESGEEIWKYDLGKASGTLRGVTYWRGDKDNPPRILAGTSNGELIALNAKTGKLVPGFGTGGTVDLRPGVSGKFPGAPYHNEFSGDHLQEPNNHESAR